MTEKVPDLIAGRYEVVSQIGSGGFSVVYKAYDRSLQKDVAIKMLLHTEQIDAEQIRRFQQEAKIASGLHHSNLIRVLDCGVTKKNDPFLVMDYVEGTSLCDYIETNGPLPVKKAVRIFVQICEGMQQAHEQGILHRDLKTSNVMLVDAQSSCPRAIILDFGLA